MRARVYINVYTHTHTHTHTYIYIYILKGTDDLIPETLQEGLVDSISNEECREIHFGFIRDTHICAGTGTPNACSVSTFL